MSPAHKSDQGRFARFAAFWALAALGFLGIYQARYWFESWGGGVGDWFRTPLMDGPVPILGLDLTWAVVVAWLAAGPLFAFSLHRALNREQAAEYLIGTEAELRKVSWPTLEEAVNSSLVVVLTVVVLLFWMMGADWILARGVEGVLFR